MLPFHPDPLALKWGQVQRVLEEQVRCFRKLPFMQRSNDGGDYKGFYAALHGVALEDVTKDGRISERWDAAC